MFAEACQALDDLLAETTLPPDFKISLQGQAYRLSGGFRAESGRSLYQWQVTCFDGAAPFEQVTAATFDAGRICRRCSACAQPGKPVIGVKARRKPVAAEPKKPA